MSKRKSTGGRGLRVLLTVLCIVCGLVLAGMLGATVYINHLYSQMNYVDPDVKVTISPEEMEQIKKQEAEETDPNATGPTIDRDEELDVDHEVKIGGRDSGIVNILLLGLDRRPTWTHGRSDAMILCTFNKVTGDLTMTSFMRDSWVYLPGYGNQRLNAAVVFGGIPMLLDTFEENFGVHVDGVFQVDFAQFPQVIDYLGGVELEISEAEAVIINRSGGDVTAGWQTLSGQEALTYSRIRSLDGDHNRTNRQRKVMGSLIQRFKSAELNTLLELMEQILPMITTTMTQGEIITLATDLFPMLAEMEVVSQVVPAAGTYYSVMIDGMSVIKLDMDAARELLDSTLNNK